MSTQYGIFTNKITNKTLAYYPCPKNANSSAKLFFAKHLGVDNNFIVVPDNLPGYKQTPNLFADKKSIANFLPSKQPFTKLTKIDIKCCIVRDPIGRFISAYKNRILFHKDREFYNHTIDMVIDKLINGLFENRHFLPQTYFLGNNLKYFSFYSDINNINFFETKVNDFFGKKIEFPKLNFKRKEQDLYLKKDQLLKIKKIYIDDFEFLKI